MGDLLRGVARGVAAMLVSALFATGCVTARFAEPITSFQDSLTLSSGAIAVYYTELNQFEREIYLDERLYDPAREVLATDEQGRPTPLIGQLFGAESIKARTDAIALLGVYAQRLGELAGSEAPRQFAGGANVLGENLFNLEKTFAKLGKDDAEKKESMRLRRTTRSPSLVSILDDLLKVASAFV